MKITYELSNRQRKELLVRGAPLQIAIPTMDDPDDPLQFARESLPIDAECIVSAEVGDVFIVQASCAGLAGLLGSIVDPDHAISKGKIPLCVRVVLAELSPSKPRANPLVVAWPGRGFVNGLEFVRPNDEEKI